MERDGFVSGDGDGEACLRILAVGPVDFFAEEAEEVLMAGVAAADGGHEVRFVDEGGDDDGLRDRGFGDGGVIGEAVAWGWCRMHDDEGARRCV